MADDAAPTREDVHEPGAEPSEAAPRPDDEAASAVLDRFPESVFADSHGQPVVYVGRDTWRDLAAFLRDEQAFSQCVDLTAVDHLVDADRALPPGVAGARYEVVANFLSHARNRRIRAITQVPTAEPELATITDVYPSVAFAEREVFDLFGIVFTGHDDLARILMPDDWIGFPLRKDDAPARVPVTFKEDPRPR